MNANNATRSFLRLSLAYVAALVLTVAAVTPATPASAGNWSSPATIYKLQDVYGMQGFHRIKFVWTPFSGGNTWLTKTSHYVAITAPHWTHSYRCYYIGFDAPYISNSIAVWESASGWNATSWNTPQTVDAFWNVNVPGLILQESGMANNSNGQDCFWFQNNLALLQAYIPHNSDHVACYYTERHPAWVFSNFCYQ